MITHGGAQLCFCVYVCVSPVEALYPAVILNKSFIVASFHIKFFIIVVDQFCSHGGCTMSLVVERRTDIFERLLYCF